MIFHHWAFWTIHEFTSEPLTCTHRVTCHTIVPMLPGIPTPPRSSWQRAENLQRTWRNMHWMEAMPGWCWHALSWCRSLPQESPWWEESLFWSFAMHLSCLRIKHPGSLPSTPGLHLDAVSANISLESDQSFDCYTVVVMVSFLVMVSNRVAPLYTRQYLAYHSKWPNGLYMI